MDVNHFFCAHHHGHTPIIILKINIKFMTAQLGADSRDTMPNAGAVPNDNSRAA